MIRMEEYISKLTLKINEDNNYTKDQMDIIEYGLFALIQTVASIALILLFGILFSVIVESIILALAIASLRKSSGGVHATLPSICLIVGTTIVIALSLLAKCIPYSFSILILYILLWIGDLIIIYMKSPVASTNKPIKNINKIKRLKIKSVGISIVLFLVSLVGILYTYKTGVKDYYIFAWCVTLGVTWQALTLTNMGDVILSKIDSFLYKLLNKRGE